MWRWSYNGASAYNSSRWFGGRKLAQIVNGMNDVRLVAVCDVVEDNAKDVVSSLSISEVFTDHKQMLNTIQPDCVLMVTPTYTHAEITIDALNTSAHVFCEKPMAITLAECNAMIDAAQRNNRKLMIGFVRRFQPNYRL